MIKIEDVKVGTKIKYKDINNIQYYEVKEIKDIHNLICENPFRNSILFCLDENNILYKYTKNVEIIDDEEYFDFIKYINSTLFNRSNSLYCNECEQSVISFYDYVNAINIFYCGNPNCKNHKKHIDDNMITIPEWCYIEFSNMFTAFVDTQNFCTICYYPKIITNDNVSYCSNPDCSKHI